MMLVYQLDTVEDRTAIKAMKTFGVAFEQNEYGIIQGKLPTPHTQISRDDFDKLFFLAHYVQSHRIYMQLYNGTTYIGEVAIHVFRSYAVGVAKSYHMKKPLNAHGLSHWTGNEIGAGHLLSFYRIGCEHEFGPDEGKRMFEHKFTCHKCGYVNKYDSSG